MKDKENIECTCTEECSTGYNPNCTCEHSDCNCTEKPKEEKKEKKSKKQNKEMIKLLEEKALTEEKLLRLQAEYVNFRNRQAGEVEKLLKYEGESFIKELLSVVDNFERALSGKGLSEELSNFLEGFRLIYNNLIDILKSNGVEEIEVLGKDFDPNIAEAVTTEKHEDKKVGVVLEVFQKGYIYKDKIIRPAMVKVNN